MELTPTMSVPSLEKSRIKVVLLEGIHPSAVQAFQADGYTDVEHYPKSLAPDELRKVLKNAYLIGIRSATYLTREVLAEAPKLISIGCFCIGTNQVNLEAAQTQGVPVFNAPFSNTRSVAELVVAEVVLLLRGIPHRASAAQRGEWIKTATGSFEVRGKTLGIVGYGHIGTQVGLLAEAFGMQVIFYDIETKLALGNAKAVPSLRALLDQSDVVTLHVPDTPQTKGMIGSAEIAQMKKRSCLINAARGSLVDIEALAESLRAKHLAGAALDVFPKEPKTEGEEFVSPLRGMSNVILTPHVGGSTEEAQANIGIEVAEKLIKYSNNGSTLSAVNFPEVSLPAPHTRQHRLLHIHRNQPGMLSAVNGVFSRHNVNIAGEYLQTNPEIGYVVIDMETRDRAESQALKQELDQIPGTLRTRLLY